MWIPRSKFCKDETFVPVDNALTYHRPPIGPSPILDPGIAPGMIPRDAGHRIDDPTSSGWVEVSCKDDNPPDDDDDADADDASPRNRSLSLQPSTGLPQRYEKVRKTFRSGERGERREEAC